MKKSRIVSLLCCISLVLSLSSVVFSNDDKTDTAKTQSLNYKNSIMLFVGSPLALVNNEETQIDSTNLDVVPIVKNNRTLVPVKFISEKLGISIKWDPTNYIATITKDKKTIKVFAGTNKIVKW